MFGKTKKENKNYYVSPLPEAFLSKAAVRASVIAIAAALPFIAALVLWIYPGIGSLLWIYGYYEAMVAYWALFTCSGIGLVVCAVMSFFGYKLRKEVMQKSAPTFGFRKSSYNGIFISALLVSLLLVFQIVLLVGYHVSVGSGYIDTVIAGHADLAGKTASADVAGIVVAALFALSAAGEWTYYVYTYRVNRVMQFVSPDDGKVNDAPAPPDPKEAAKHRPDKPRFTFGLTPEEKELGRREFEGYEEQSEEKEDKENTDDKK